MNDAVMLLNFGEPENPSLGSVIRYLERIFSANASLEDRSSRDLGARSRELAESRAPGLLEEYRKIGGSPLNAQAGEQADALATRLADRGLEVRTFVAMQFLEPLIPDVVARAHAEGVRRILGLPVYPLCGRSTNVAALESLARAVAAVNPEIELLEVSGWHRHPEYVSLRVEAIRRHAAEAGVDLEDASTRLVFSAHGTPLRYLDEGNRYDRYVEEWCQMVAGRLPVATYSLGFQNHANRGVPWTAPDIEDAIRDLVSDSRDGSAKVRRVVVDPVSFMHEQSETLAELDGELREVAEEAGLEFFRVPVPWDEPRFADVLADLVEPLLGSAAPARVRFGECRCRPGAACLNQTPRAALADA